MARYQERIDQDKALSSVIEICLVRICSKQIRTKQNASLAPFSALFRCKFAIIFIDVASIEYKALYTLTVYSELNRKIILYKIISL